MIDGARQVGKTYIIEEFGRTHYESVVKIDFVKMKGVIGLFQDVEDEKEIMMFLEQNRMPETMICDIGDPIAFP